MSKGLDEIDRLWETAAKRYLLACEFYRATDDYSDIAIIDRYRLVAQGIAKEILEGDDDK